MKRSFLLIALLLVTLAGIAQKNVTLNIAHKLGAADFAFNDIATNDLSQDFQITRVDYYISGIILLHDGGMATPLPDKYILVKGNGNVSESLGSFPVTDVEGIKFSIGVEAPTNNADPSTYPEHHPLSFHTPSMHWGWSAGYRFVALEGKAGNDFATTFELHGLWNENYFQQTVMAAGVNSGDEVAINLDADYTQALRGIDVASGPIAHGVNQDDLTVLQNFRDHVFKPGSGTTSITALAHDNDIHIYPNPSKGLVTVELSGSKHNVSHYTVADLSGRLIQEGAMPATGKIRVTERASGLYVLSLYEKEIPVFVEKIMMEQ